MLSKFSFLEQICLIFDEKSEVRLYLTTVVETSNYVRCCTETVLSKTFHSLCFRLRKFVKLSYLIMVLKRTSVGYSINYLYFKQERKLALIKL